MAIVVVATTLVAEARSKRVEGVTGESKSPPFDSSSLRSESLRAGSSRKGRGKDGVFASFLLWVKRPKALRETRWLWCVTAMEAAGKAPVGSCFFRMGKDRIKRSLWSSHAGSSIMDP